MNDPSLGKLWIVAGPNGAGKTSSVQRQPIGSLLPPVRFLNPDDVTLQRLRAAGFSGFADAQADVQKRTFAEAAEATSQELESLLRTGAAAGVETVLSTDKYRAAVLDVRRAGGYVGLIYVFLSSPEIAIARVAERVRRGGHGVPPDNIIQRWRRSLDQLSWFAGHASAFWVFDNSSPDPKVDPPLVASGTGGRLLLLTESAHAEIRAALASLPS